MNSSFSLISIVRLGNPLSVTFFLCLPSFCQISPKAPLGEKQSARSTTGSLSSRSRSEDRETGSPFPTRPRRRVGGQSPTRQQKQQYKHQSQMPDRRLWIEARVDTSQWPLSLRNWSFLEDKRRQQLQDYLGSLTVFINS